MGELCPVWQLGREPRLRQRGWDSLRMNMMGKEFAVVIETNSGWMRYSPVGNGENATYHQALLRDPPF